MDKHTYYITTSEWRDGYLENPLTSEYYTKESLIAALKSFNVECAWHSVEIGNKGIEGGFFYWKQDKVTRQGLQDLKKSLMELCNELTQ